MVLPTVNNPCWLLHYWIDPPRKIDCVQANVPSIEQDIKV